MCVAEDGVNDHGAHCSLDRNTLRFVPFPLHPRAPCQTLLTSSIPLLCGWTHTLDPSKPAIEPSGGDYLR